MSKDFDPAKSVNTETIGVSVTLDLKKKIRAVADVRSQSVSEYCRQAIVDRMSAASASRAGQRTRRPF